MINKCAGAYYEYIWQRIVINSEAFGFQPKVKSMFDKETCLICDYTRVLSLTFSKYHLI